MTVVLIVGVCLILALTGMLSFRRQERGREEDRNEPDNGITK